MVRILSGIYEGRKFWAHFFWKKINKYKFRQMQCESQGSSFLNNLSFKKSQKLRLNKKHNRRQIMITTRGSIFHAVESSPMPQYKDEMFTCLNNDIKNPLELH